METISTYLVTVSIIIIKLSDIVCDDVKYYVYDDIFTVALSHLPVKDFPVFDSKDSRAYSVRRLRFQEGSIEASIWVSLIGGIFCLSAPTVLKKARLKLGNRHVKHKFYDDIQSRNVTISFKSLRYK